jgi:hypothetical protein
MYEPPHPLFPYDKDHCSYKNKTAGYNYQIGLSTVEQKIFAVDGPFPAGSHNDKKIWNNSQLRQRLLEQNKRAITDGGYNGCDGSTASKQISTSVVCVHAMSHSTLGLRAFPSFPQLFVSRKTGWSATELS